MSVTHELQHLSTIAFETAGNPYAWASMAVAPVVWSVAHRDRKRLEPETELAGVQSGDDVLALDVLANTTEDRKETVEPRWREPKTIAGGAFIVGLTLLNPTFDHEIPVPDAAIVVVGQDSTTMRLTKDMEDGESRRLSLQNGLRLAMPSMPEDLLTGVVNFSAKASTDLGLSSDRDALLASIDARAKDPTRPDLADAIRTVDDIFEGYTGSEAESAIVITDGLVEEAGLAINGIEELKAKGIDVSVIVTGDKDASYKRTIYDETSVDSGANSEVFTDAGIDVETAKSDEDIANHIEDIVKKVSTDNEQRPSKLAEALRAMGSIAGFSGFALWMRRSWKRKV